MLIGVGGPSRAGKSTLSMLLAAALGEQGHTVAVVHQDEHVVPEEDLPLIRDKPDWELPESIDWSALQAEIDRVMLSHDIVIVEGLLSFYDDSLRAQMDHHLLVNIDHALFVHRKREDLRWGSAPEPDWYIEHIWQSYLKYGLPEEAVTYLQLDGSRYFDIGSIVAYLLGEEV